MDIKSICGVGSLVVAALVAGVTLGVRGAHMIDRALGSDMWRRPTPATGKAVR